MQRKKLRWILVAVLVLLLGIYLFVPAVHQQINQAVSVLAGGVEGVIEYLRGYKEYAAVVSFFLMVLQSIVSPIPAFVITLANAAIFGWVQGAALSWFSSMIGAILCFYIARILGRDAVAKFAGGQKALQTADDFFDRYGQFAILIARLLPFVSFDLISYAAGLTSMRFWSFVWATGLGQLPATIVYSYVGGQLTGGAKALMMALLILFALSILIYVGRKVYNDRKAAKSD